MSSHLQPLRGMTDNLPPSAAALQAIVATASHTADLYGYQPVQVPVLERTEVFTRPLGVSSDIVSKEMYTFRDRSDTEITLRPEFTAGLVRAALHNRGKISNPARWYYHGPLFRYERPQKGRLRQFTQFGVELLSAPADADKEQAISLAAAHDFEVIAVAYRILRALGSGLEQHLEIGLQINSLGNAMTRNRYRSAIKEYFLKHQSSLSALSRTRLANNPLRILDSKEPEDQLLFADAPLYQDYWDQESRAFFTQLTARLRQNNISYSHNPRLVRGLDYYCHSVFEFVSAGAAGQVGQSGMSDAGALTILAGGRYDGLANLLGGKTLYGVGWSLGVERIANLIQTHSNLHQLHNISCGVLPMVQQQADAAWTLSEQLRSGNISCINLPPLAAAGTVSGNKLGKAITKAYKAGIRCLVLLGEDEVRGNYFTVKDLLANRQLTATDLQQLLAILGRAANHASNSGSSDDSRASD